jgi:purine-binding chemotaxis protein CheW
VSENRNTNTLNGADIQLVTFKMGNEEFGIDILQVQEINRLIEIMKVPKAPYFIEGVINMRGNIIPVVDFRKRFGMPKKESNKLTRILIIEAVEKTVSFIVDEIKEVMKISQSQIEAPPEIISGIGAEYFKGVGKIEKRLINILDVNKVFSKKEIESIETVAETVSIES